MAKRNSRIELLKIIAMFMIALSHATPEPGLRGGEWIIDFNEATTSLSQVVGVLIRNLGQIGNAIFMVASSWFLLENSRGRVKKNKVIKMVIECFTFSIFFVILAFIIHYKLPLAYILSQLAPVTLNNNWFVTCYILLYMIHPLLNSVVRTLSKRDLLVINIINVLLYSGVDFISGHSFYYYNYFVGFVCIYFIVAYVKLHLQTTLKSNRFNKRTLAIGIFGWLGMAFLSNMIGLKVHFFSDWMMAWNTFMNPFFIMIAISLFGLANSMQKIVWEKVNIVASYTLYAYMVNNNRIIKDYIRVDIWEFIYKKFSYDNLVIEMWLFGTVLFLISVLLAALYSVTLKKAVEKISIAISNWIDKIVGKWIDKLLLLK